MLAAVGLIIVISIFVLFASQYREYAFAQVWHYRHGDSVKFGMNEIEIPRLWWVTKNDNAGRISIQRACKSTAYIDSEIEVAPVGPGEVAENDDEQSRLEHAVVLRNNRDSQTGWTYSSISLKARGSVWYCTKDQQTVLGRSFATDLLCHAPRIPYSLHYQGPPDQEGEAKLIFASSQ
jgi:hypothetical protein